MNDDSTDMMQSMASHWGLVLLFGIISIILGGLLIANPGAGVLAVTLLIGLEFFIAGIFRFVRAFGHSGAGHRIWWIVLGLLGVVVGIFLMRHLVSTALALGIIIGIFWFVTGIFELFASIEAKGESGRGWGIFMGIIGIIAGLYLMFVPVSIVVIAWVAGIWLVVYGVMTAIMSFSLKKASPAAPAAA